MKIIKNAIVYAAQLPSADAMREHLGEFPYAPLGEVMMNRASFVPTSKTSELVTPIEGGYVFTLRLDEKILPSYAVTTAVADRVAEIEKAEERQVTRKERTVIREEIILDMVRRALVKTTYVTCIYDQSNGYLIVPVSSRTLADSAVTMIIKAVGSVETKTIHISEIKHGLTARLTKFMDEDLAAFDGFTPEGYCQLVNPSEKGEKVSYQIENLESATGAIKDRLGSGYVVDRIGLTDGSTAFKLTSDFHFKSIRFEYDTEYDESEEADAAHQWRHEASVQMVLFSNTVNKLVKLLEYKAEEAAK